MIPQSVQQTQTELNINKDVKKLGPTHLQPFIVI